MITPIANKYATALMNSASQDIDDIANALSRISVAYKLEKTEYILNSFLDKKIIIKLLIDIGDSSNSKLISFLHILESRKKLHILPQIYNALSLAIAKRDNKYVGFVYSNKKIDQDILSSLEKNISKEIDKNVDLVYRESDFEGVRIDIEMLGMEISFSKNQIKHKLLDSILKSI